MRYRIRFDEQLCINCKACEVHCKVWNRMPTGLKLGVHLHHGPFMREGKPVLRTVYMPCQQCDDAPCLSACPTGAMRRRADGIVYVDSPRCTGCRACVLACPWKVPQYDAASGRVRKCDLCRERLDAGLRPACVTGCVGGALEFEDQEGICSP